MGSISIPILENLSKPISIKIRIPEVYQLIPILENVPKPIAIQILTPEVYQYQYWNTFQTA